MRFGVVVAAALLAFLACGSCSAPSDGGNGGNNFGAGTPWSPVCPDALPALGSPCTPTHTAAPVPVACEYGDAWWDVACDTVVTCDGGWTIATPAGTQCTPKPGRNPASCPSSLGALPHACASGSPTCYYGTVTCFCQIEGLPYPPPDAGMFWSCDVPQGACPAVRPRLGAACSNDGLLCNTGGGLFGEECLGGFWQQAVGGP